LWETLLKKGYPPNPLPKTFITLGVGEGDIIIEHVPLSNPCEIKVFGKEFEEKPFFKKVCLKILFFISRFD
jgi:hypothetical protein